MFIKTPHAHANLKEINSALNILNLNSGRVSLDFGCLRWMDGVPIVPQNETYAKAYFVLSPSPPPQKKNSSSRRLKPSSLQPHSNPHLPKTSPISQFKTSNSNYRNQAHTQVLTN